jgi:hypothetical protein
MTDSSGSRWYFPVFEGLFDAKHVEQMGQAIWLYGWVLARAWISKTPGVIHYTHTEAAQELGVCDRTARLWFKSLQECGYLITRARHAYHLEVEVSKWRSIEEWLDSRQGESPVKQYRTEGESPVTHYHSEVEIGNEIGNVNGNKLPMLPLTIRLESYEFPVSTPGAVRPTLSEAFHGLLEVLRTAANKPAILREIYELCFPGDAPDYGYLGKVAVKVGGAGRLAEILWQLSTKPPTGDVLDYITKAYGRERGNGSAKRAAPRLSAIEKVLHGK